MTGTMEKPQLRAYIAEGVDEYKKQMKSFIASNPDDVNARIDFMSILLKNEDYQEFLAEYDSLGPRRHSAPAARQYAKYLLHVRHDPASAREVLAAVSSRDPKQPAWVHYFAGRRRVYYERLCDGLLYTAIPKNASTSLKTFILDSVLGEKGKNPHSVFGNPFFNSNIYDRDEIDQSTKVLVLRRPEDRFTSYYWKNIVAEDSLAYEYGIDSATTPTLFGLDLKPSLDALVENYSRYCVVFNDVFHHTLPQAAYVGDLSEYDFVCDVSEVDDLVEFVASRLGFDDHVPKKAPREMTGESRSSRPKAVPAADISQLYADDYAMLSFSQGNAELTDGVRAYVPDSTIFSPYAR